MSGNTPRYGLGERSLRARIASAVTDRFADRPAVPVGEHAEEIAAVAVGVVGEPFPGVDLSACTHGGDCPVHPDVHQLHNFDPTAEEILGAVLAAVQIRHKFDADDVRDIASRYGLTVGR